MVATGDKILLPTDDKKLLGFTIRGVRQRAEYVVGQQVSMGFDRAECGCATICTGEKRVLSRGEKGKFEEKKRSALIRSAGRKAGKKIACNGPESGNQNRGTDKCNPGRMRKEAGSLGDSSQIRKEKVKEAKRKKQNGDYDSREVYQKIADRLLDLFGI